MSNPSPRIGDQLYALAVRVVDAATLRHVIEPTLADLQHELRDVKSGPRRLWTTWRGYAAFWQVLCLELLWGKPPMDKRVMLRLVAGTALALGAYVLVLRLLPLVLYLSASMRKSWLPYLAVEGLASMMPFAVFASVLWWARAGAVRGQRLKIALIVGVSAGLVATAIGIWAVPPLQASISTSPALSWGARLLGAAVRGVWAQTAATAFALLGFALAPHARRRVLLSLFLVVVPLMFVIVQGAISVMTSRFGGPSLIWDMLLARLMPYIFVLGLSGWMLRSERAAV